MPTTSKPATEIGTCADCERDEFRARYPLVLTIANVTYRAITIGSGPGDSAFLIAEWAGGAMVGRIIGDIWLSRSGRLLRLKSKDEDKTRIAPLTRQERARVKAWIRRLQEKADRLPRL